MSLSADSIPVMARAGIAARISAVCGLTVDEALEGVRSSDLMGAIGAEFRAPIIDLAHINIDEDLLKVFLKVIPKEQFVALAFFPFCRAGNTVFCATPHPWNVLIRDCCKQVLGQDSEVVVFLVEERGLDDFLHRRSLTSDTDYREKADRFAGNATEVAEHGVRLNPEEESTWGVLSQLLKEAIHLGATDVHLQVEEDRVRVRAEINGNLQDLKPLPRGMSQVCEHVIYNKTQTMKGDHRMFPQHGNISFDYGGRHIDLRIASAPCFNPTGEYQTHISIRFQDSRRNEQVMLDTLGFSEANLEMIRGAIETPGALCIVAGPTGSGKTTTLGACMKHLARADRMIYAIEDPVENFYPGINHILVRGQENQEARFGGYVRALLRKKPNIIMIGEIRDRETGEAVYEAAMTGHTVLTTVHADFAHEIPERLTQVGIQPWQVASKLELCSSQRLISLLCPHCAESYECRAEDAAACHFPADFAGRRLRRRNASGCTKCNVGYIGRRAVIEIVKLDDALRAFIANGEKMQTQQFKALLRQRDPNRPTLHSLALEAIANGETDYDGVCKVIRL